MGFPACALTCIARRIPPLTPFSLFALFIPQELLLWLDANSDTQGAVLVFLPGMGEIQTLYDSLSGRREFARDGRFWLLPLHSSLSSQEQALVFRHAPPGVRKVVLATNIAETSITVDDVEYVIDTGRVKESAYEKRKRMATLQEVWVSSENTRQRIGRAGRVRAGQAFLLYTKHRALRLLKAHRVPEIQRLPLEEVVLQLKVRARVDGRESACGRSAVRAARAEPDSCGRTGALCGRLRVCLTHTPFFVAAPSPPPTSALRARPPPGAAPGVRGAARAEQRGRGCAARRRRAAARPVGGRLGIDESR